MMREIKYGLYMNGELMQTYDSEAKATVAKRLYTEETGIPHTVKTLVDDDKFNGITVHMYMSRKEFQALQKGEVCYGYSEGFTTYPIHVEVPIEFVEDSDVSEGLQEAYEYKVTPK